MELVLSIAEIADNAAAEASIAGEAFRAFFYDVKVDTVATKGLADDIQDLGVACSSVNDRLKKFLDGYDGHSRKPGSDLFWTCLYTQVACSLDTVRQLQAALRNIDKEGADLFAQILRQIRRHMQVLGLGEARNRIQSQIAVSQISLLTIVIEACYLFPQRIDEHLPVLLDQTRQYVEQLRTLQAQRADPDTLETSHETDILDISARAIEDGNNLCASTTIKENASSASSESESPTCENIHAWIDHVDSGLFTSVQLPEVASLKSSDDGEASADEQDNSKPNQVPRTKRNSDRHQSSSSDKETSEDVDLYVEAAQNAKKTGQTFYEERDFLSAFAYFSEALRMAKDLSKRQQQACDIWSLRYMHGVAAFHSRAPVDAELTLQDVLANAPEVDLQTRSVRLQIFETVHLLVQVEVKLGNLEKALAYGEFSLKGRRRVLGKTNYLSYESVALVLHILELQESPERRESFLKMLPQDRENTFSTIFEGLLPLTTEPVEDAVPPPPPAKSSRRSTRTSNIMSLSITVQEQPHKRDSFHSVVSRSSFHSGVSSNYSEPSSLASTAPATCPSPGLFDDETKSASEHRASAMRRLASRAIDNRASVVRPDLARSSSCFVPQTYRPMRPTSHPHMPLSRSVSFYEPHHENAVSSEMSDRSSVALMPIIDEQPYHVQRSERFAELVPFPLRTQRPANFAEISEYDVSPPSYEDSRPSSINNSSVDGSSGSPSSSHSRAPSSISLSGPATPTNDIKTPPMYESFALPPSIHPAERQSLSSSRNSFASEHVVSPVPQEFSPQNVPWKHSEEFHLRRRSLLRMFRAAHPMNENQSMSDTDYDGVRLSKKDLASVKSEILSDDAMAFWQEHLENSILNGSQKYILLRPSAGMRLLHDSEDAADIMQGAISAQTMHLFIPLRTRMNPHWSLLLVSIQDGVACHYDPQIPMNRSASERVTGKISTILNKQFTYYSVPNVPQQINTKDSGVMVNFYMQHLIKKLQATHVSEKTDASILARAVDVKAERKDMLKVIEAKRKSVGARFMLDD